MGFIASAQTPSSCVAISCPQYLPYTQTVDTLISQVTGFTPTGYLWTVAYGPGVLAAPTASNTIITGLQPGVVTLVKFTAFNNSTSLGTQTFIAVNAAPVPCPVPPVTIAYTLVTIVRTDSSRATTILK